MSKQGEQKVIRYRYYAITGAIVLFLLVFQIIYNLNYFLSTTIDEPSKMQDIQFSDLTAAAQGTKGAGFVTDTEPKYAILDAEEGTELASSVAKQIELNKTKYTMVDSLDDLSATARKSLEVVFVCRNDISDTMCDQITSLLDRGINAVFLQMPDETSLSNQTLLDIMGIKTVKGKLQNTGILFVAGFFLSDVVLELERIPLEYVDVELCYGCKTYAYSTQTDLEDDNVENESRPPLIWRSMHGGGEVYTINGGLASLTEDGSILLSILSKMQDVFVYPIINAYCVIVAGMPFIKEETPELLEQIYSRTALGAQQDLLFPAVSGSCQRYNCIPTYALDTGPVVDGKVVNENVLLPYYLKEISAQMGELALYYREGINDVDLSPYIEGGKPNVVYLDQDKTISDYSGSLSNCTIVIGHWDNNLDFTPVTDKIIGVPVIVSGLLPDDMISLKQSAYVTALGLLTVDINIHNVINPLSEEYYWTRYGKEYETVLGVHARDLPYLDRLSVSDAAKRIRLYQLIVPDIEYREEACTIKIDNFLGEAYFVLRTNKVLTGVENGTYKEISENAYMIEANADTVVITYQEETRGL